MLVADTGYANGPNYALLEAQHIAAWIPVFEQYKSDVDGCPYDAQTDSYRCPAGKQLLSKKWSRRLMWLGEILPGYLSGAPTMPVQTHLHHKGHLQTIAPQHLRRPLPPGVAEPTRPAHASGETKYSQARIWKFNPLSWPRPDERARPGRRPQNYAIDGRVLRPQKATQPPANTPRPLLAAQRHCKRRNCRTPSRPERLDTALFGQSSCLGLIPQQPQ